MRRVNAAGVNLTKTSEGCKLAAYLDGGGVPTQGWGHTRGVVMGTTITQEQADLLLLEDMAEASTAVERLVTTALTDNQFAALTDFVFNLGDTEFANSTLLKKLNAGNYLAVPAELKRWVYDDHKIQPGLVKRRAAEALLWQTPDPEEETA